MLFEYLIWNVYLCQTRHTSKLTPGVDTDFLDAKRNLHDIAITPRLDIILSDFSQAANTFSLVLFSGAVHSNFSLDPSTDFETKYLQIP